MQMPCAVDTLSSVLNVKLLNVTRLLADQIDPTCVSVHNQYSSGGSITVTYHRFKVKIKISNL